MNKINKFKILQSIHIGFFLVTITGVGLVSVLNKPVQLDNFSITSVINGANARTLEDNYDNNLFIKEFGVNLWAAIEYKLFNEGKPGLVVGQEGWLFTDEEFSVSSNSKYAIESNTELIKWVNTELNKNGVTLVVVPVPAKARLYADKLNATKPDVLHQASYGALIDELQENSIHVIDSLTAMQVNKTSKAQYLRTDTHWTPAGAETVAGMVANYINQYVDVDLNTKSYVTKLVRHTSLSGDLLNYLPVSPWFDSLLPENDKLELYETYTDAEEDIDDLFGDASESVALVGTSYSANQDWNFIGALKQALSIDIINYAEAGHGPIDPMMKFLSRIEEGTSDLELVIWEIPERYLTVSYDEAYSQQITQKLQPTLVAQEINLSPRSL